MAAERARAETELGQAIKECLFQARLAGRSPDTIRSYRHLLRSTLRYACEQGVTTPDGSTPAVVRNVATSMLSRGQSHNTAFKGGEAMVRSLFSAVHYFARWAADQGLHVPDLSKLKMPRLRERVQARVSADEFRAMEAAIEQRRVTGDPRFSRFTVARDLALISFLGDTGLRAHEVRALNVADVDLEHGSVIVRRGKGGKGRALCILDVGPDAQDGGPTLEALRTYLSERAQVPNVDKTEAFWVTRYGRRLSRDVLLDVLARICHDAGMSESRPPHAFRRAHFTENYNAQASSLLVLVARMGWASVETNMIGVYTRGATVDLARTQPLPSIARQWRREALQPVAQPASGFDDTLTGELLKLATQKPQRVRALLQALRGVA